MPLLECAVIIFDFDGVLYAGSEGRALGLSLLSRAITLGYHVYMVSGRARRDLPLIKRTLREAGVRLSALAGVYLRGEGGEEAFKLETYTDILGKESCILEIHDDNPEALWPARRLVSGGLILHHGDKCSVLYGSSVFPECST